MTNITDHHNLTYNISNQIQEKLRQGSKDIKSGSGYSEYLYSIKKNSNNYMRDENLSLSGLEPNLVNPDNYNSVTNKIDSENSVNSKNFSKINSNQIIMSKISFKF